MTTAALPRAPWRAPQAERFGVGAAFSLLAHTGLVVALALGLHWRNDPPVAASAELWATVPQMAAPAAVPAPAPTPVPAPPVARRETPPPPPTEADAQIAIERARVAQRKAQEAAEQRQAKEAAAEQLKAQKLADAKAREAKAAEQRRQQEQKEASEAQAEAQRIAAAREENLKRMLAQAGGAGGNAAGNSGGTAARDAGPSAALAGRIKARIKPNIKLLTEVAGNPIAEVEVRCSADGTIIGRRIVKPSGNAVWDETVLRAIDATPVLPRDTDGRIPGTIILVFAPRDL